MAISLMAHPVRDSFQSYSQQYAKYLEQPRHVPSLPTSYSSHTQRPAPAMPLHVASPRAPTSPAASSDDGNRPSLPSISNLLGLADGPKHDRPPQRSPVTSHPAQQYPSHSTHAPVERPVSRAHSHHPSYSSTEGLHRSSLLPPTPPLRNDSVLEGRRSPPNTSPRSVYSQPYHTSASIRHHEAGPPSSYVAKRQSLPSQTNPSPYYATSPYATSPGGRSNASVYSAPEPHYTTAPPPPADLYHQRPLPTNFPPQPPTLPLQAAPGSIVSSANPWEHHHYINSSSQAPYAQSNERYVCPTCTKAFSRPSSLKIHTHSHTGEKPFKCPHAGCGKAFSVRSNMKRHERGCHVGLEAAAAQGVRLR